MTRLSDDDTTTENVCAAGLMTLTKEIGDRTPQALGNCIVVEENSMKLYSIAREDP